MQTPRVTVYLSDMSDSELSLLDKAIEREWYRRDVQRRANQLVREGLRPDQRAKLEPLPDTTIREAAPPEVEERMPGETRAEEAAGGHHSTQKVPAEPLRH
ncbi:hypothetical protein [Magnetospirillum sp. UT-4]|uniref:hypothetical protein n=1 Tax=Magnetospirillum sp. UT-4 TaxID=2681467 RepID=UPI0013851C6A|nr:hypothetical protein [Magnetospirillum sp. UT-4]CAA7622276.1 hypothetical protein MTBUT4_400033 [Magnetospirillum sp. UT-4]